MGASIGGLPRLNLPFVNKQLLQATRLTTVSTTSPCLMPKLNTLPVSIRNRLPIRLGPKAVAIVITMLPKQIQVESSPLFFADRKLISFD